MLSITIDEEREIDSITFLISLSPLFYLGSIPGKLNGERIDW